MDAPDAAGQGRHQARAQRVQEFRDGRPRGQQAPYQVCCGVVVLLCRYITSSNVDVVSVVADSTDHDGCALEPERTAERARAAERAGVARQWRHSCATARHSYYTERLFPTTGRGRTCDF